MARSSKVDPADRFRFRVTVLEEGLSTLTSNFFATLQGEQIKQIGTGFSEITLPKADVSEIFYRENLNPHRFMKKPGLTRYEPITLKKGVTSDRELYNWFKKVSNDAIGYSVGADLVAAFQIAPSYPNFSRKDLLISSLDRTGQVVKCWVILDAFPIGYKGGNDFDANSSEKLIQELTLTFEAFVELQDEDLTELTKEAKKAAADASTVVAAGFTISDGNSGGGLF